MGVACDYFTCLGPKEIEVTGNRIGMNRDDTLQSPQLMVIAHKMMNAQQSYANFADSAPPPNR